MTANNIDLMGQVNTVVDGFTGSCVNYKKLKEDLNRLLPTKVLPNSISIGNLHLNIQEEHEPNTIDFSIGLTYHLKTLDYSITLKLQRDSEDIGKIKADTRASFGHKMTCGVQAKEETTSVSMGEAIDKTINFLNQTFN